MTTCPQCSTVYLGSADICDWCAVATTPVDPEWVIAPIKTKPAIPAECWNDTPVNTDAAMDATRVMCGRSA